MKRLIYKTVMAANSPSEYTVARRKGYGCIIKITDRFGNFKYVLLDNDGQFVQEDLDFNKLNRILYSDNFTLR